MPDDFNKSKTPSFDGELKNIEDEEAWLFGMNKFFKLHDYKVNTKIGITIFSLKGKANIWWEDVKRVRGIKTEELGWHEFNRLFKKKYFSERYYVGKSNKFYELKMGYITDEE